ncbi:MAG: carbon-monoxide dehydrogenase medium subunit [Gammaproteobacteria bacterium]|jgi:carbon-monoxide dehydrogenase medium subunit
MKPVAFQYYKTDLLDDAIERLRAAGDGAKLISGGQSLGPMLNLRLARPRQLIDIGSIAALRMHESTDTHVVLGAATTHAEIEDGQVPDPFVGALREVAAGIAYRAVRNKGTIGGSIAHADPAADWLSLLLCANARVRIQGAAGSRQLPIDELLMSAYTTALYADEIITHVEIPQYGGDVRFGFYKICRKVGEFADAIGAVLVSAQRRYCRVVVGAIGSKPAVLADTTRAFASTATCPELATIKADIAASTFERDPAKLHMAAVSVSRAINKAMARP